MSEPGTEWPADLKEITSGDFLIEMRRIADALETISGKTAKCNTEHVTGKVCVLDPTHVGHHASADGRLRWLDDE